MQLHFKGLNTEYYRKKKQIYVIDISQTTDTSLLQQNEIKCKYVQRNTRHKQ